MKKILLAPLLILALSACSNSANLVSQDKCSKYTDDVHKELIKQCGSDAKCTFHLDQIFYSPSLNSCLIAFYRDRFLTESDNKTQKEWGWYVINDFVNKKEVYTSKMISVEDASALAQKKAEYEKKIGELRK